MKLPPTAKEIAREADMVMYQHEHWFYIGPKTHPDTYWFASNVAADIAPFLKLTLPAEWDTLMRGREIK